MPLHHAPLPRLRRVALLAALLAAAACDRDILRDDGRPADPSLVRARSSAAEMGAFEVTGMNASGDVVGNAGGQPYRWTAGGGQVPLAFAGTRAEALGINAGGTVVGTVTTDARKRRAAVWGPGGQVQLLPDVAGLSLMGGFINDAGVVAGTTVDSAGNAGFFRWSAQGGMELLPYNGPGTDYGPGSFYLGFVADLNAAGDVLTSWEEGCWDEGPGITCYGTGEFWAGGAVWRPSGEQRTLDPLGEPSLSAVGLNDAGIAVGCIGGTPARWLADGSAQLLGTGGYDYGCATAVNGSGTIAGFFGTSSGTRGFRWTEAGGMQDLGSLGRWVEVWDINARGDVAGAAGTASGSASAYLWTAEAGVQALAPLAGTTWSIARFVNDAREVAGVSGAPPVLGNNGRRATRWSGVVVNQPPVASAGGPYTRIAGRRYAYDGSGSSDADGTLRYSWDMDRDGVFDVVTNAAAAAYTYAQPGSYTIRLVVLDDGGRADTATATALVEANVAPVAAITGMPASVAEGALLSVAATVSDGNQDVDSTELRQMRYRWEWGDGAVSATKAATHRYADQGTFTVRLIVTDAGGLADTVVRTLPVGNVAPTGRLTSPASIREGTPFTLTASALSDGPADVAAGLQVAFDCGGGRLGAFGTALSIVCPARPDQGSVTVAMRVRDKDGAGSSTTRTLAVGNVPPQVTAEAASPTTIAAGGSFTIRGTFTDPAAGDGPWQYRIYWGDGASTPLAPAPSGAPITGTHAYAAHGSYAVQVAVVDKDGGSGRSAPVTVTVTP